MTKTLSQGDYRLSYNLRKEKGNFIRRLTTDVKKQFPLSNFYNISKEEQSYRYNGFFD